MRIPGNMRKVFVLAAALVAASASASEITPASVIAEMNVRRAAFGAPPLREDARLDQATADRLSDMLEQGYWAHVSPEGRQPFEWIRPHGYDFVYAGENLAAGFETAEVLVDAWMESKGHRDNILSLLFRDCGVSIIDGSTTGRAVGRSVVVIFARDRNKVYDVPDAAPATPLLQSDRLPAPRR